MPTPTLYQAYNWLSQQTEKTQTIQAIALIEKQPMTIPGFVFLVHDTKNTTTSWVGVVNTDNEWDWSFAQHGMWSNETGNRQYRKLCGRFWVGMPDNARPNEDLSTDSKEAS